MTNNANNKLKQSFAKGSVIEYKDPWVSLGMGFKRPKGGNHDGCYNLYVSIDSEFSVRIIDEDIRVCGPYSYDSLKIIATSIETVTLLTRQLL